jgi:hypothetical protein
MITLRSFQKPSTTGWVLNGVFGGANLGVLNVCQKGAFLERKQACRNLIFARLGKPMRHLRSHTPLRREVDKATVLREVSSLGRLLV